MSRHDTNDAADVMYNVICPGIDRTIILTEGS